MRRFNYGKFIIYIIRNSKLSLYKQKEIRSYLEENIILGSQVTVEIIEINIATSFFWRYKILNCISTFLGVGYVDGVVEADEVFFAYSYKGTKPINMPRPSRKRGKQVKKAWYK